MKYVRSVEDITGKRRGAERLPITIILRSRRIALPGGVVDCLTSGNTRVASDRVAVEAGNVEGIAIVTLLRFVPIRSREWLPRGETVQMVHVGDRRACYTAGVNENANGRIRVEAGTSGSEFDDVDNARVSVVVRAKGRVHGPKVSRHRAFVVDEGNGEPESRDVPRGLATGPEVDYEVLVSDGPRNGASERRHLGII